MEVVGTSAYSHKRTFQAYIADPLGEAAGGACNEHSNAILPPLMYINANSDQGVVTYELWRCESW